MAEVLAAEPAWLSERRRQGASLAEALPLPDQKSKGWEFTDLSDLDLAAFEPAGAAATLSGAEGATVVPLADALASHEELLREKLGSLVPVEDPFVARNESGWRDGVLVHVPRGVTVAEPIRIEVPVDADGVAVGWRTLIVLEEGAEAEVWEHWSSPGDDVEGLLNSVVELSVGQGATLRYVNTQDISEKSWIFATQRAQVVIAGSELCNLFSELNDPIDQLNRFVEQRGMRDAGDDEAMMLDIDFVEMLEYGMPPACGLGFSERVFWVFEGVSAREGVPFPQLRHEIDEVTKSIYPDLKF